MREISRIVRLAHLGPEDVIVGETLEVHSATETFLIRRVGESRKPHHYEVWHAFKWGQQPLTQTNWRVCANITAAIKLMERHS